MPLSKQSLSKDWLTIEEDEARKDVYKEILLLFSFHSLIYPVQKEDRH